MAAWLKIALIAAALVLLASCAQQPMLQQMSGGDLVWPPPPNPARIAYISEIQSPDDIGVGKGFFQSLSQALKGSEERDISRPYGIAVTGSGELLIVDNAYSAVHRLDTRRGKYARIPKRPMDNFRNPVNIALGSNDRIYISDSGSNLVHVFAETGNRYVKSIGGDIFLRPTGLTVNPLTSELLVVDTKASALVVFDEKTLAFKRIVGGQTATNQATPSFHYPTNISATVDGTVYVTDSLNFRVQALNSNLEPIAEFGKAGNAPGHFSRPKGIATDSDGHVYVIDAIFDNIQVFEPNGDLLIAFGRPGKNPGEFWMPNAISIDAEDRIYISDAYNQRIQVFQYLKDEAAQ